MSRFDLESCEFVTDRLRVNAWHSAGHHADFDLAQVVAGMLTARATTALPHAWRGDFTVERTRMWINERDAESTTLLATETASGRPAGLLILHDESLDGSSVDVRLGYLIAEDAWGQGLATELVAGLVEWARSKPSVHTLTGGVDTTNEASAGVLLHNGFERIIDGDEGDATYRLEIEHRA